MPIDDVGGIDVSEDAFSIQINSGSNDDLMGVDIPTQNWNSLQGVTFKIISLEKITSQELFAAR